MFYIGAIITSTTTQERFMNINELSIRTESGEFLVTSTRVAAEFGRTHVDVIASIKEIECSANFRFLNFEESTYKTKNNRDLKCYTITKKGLYLLAMSLKGDVAAEFRECLVGSFTPLQDMFRGL